MQYSIVELYEKGLRRRREDVATAAPIIGELTVSDWRHDNDNGRLQRAAQLTRMYGTTIRQGIIAPLFDPVIMRMTRGGFVLRGMQLASMDGIVREVVQEWWVRIP